MSGLRAAAQTWECNLPENECLSRNQAFSNQTRLNQGEGTFFQLTADGFSVAGLAPLPIADFGHVLAVFVDVIFMIEEFVAQGLLGIGGARAKAWHAIDHVTHQMETIKVIQHDHIEGRGRGALFFIAAHVQVVMILAPVGESVN